MQVEVGLQVPDVWATGRGYEDPEKDIHDLIRRGANGRRPVSVWSSRVCTGRAADRSRSIQDRARRACCFSKSEKVLR